MKKVMYIYLAVIIHMLLLIMPSTIALVLSDLGDDWWQGYLHRVLPNILSLFVFFYICFTLCYYVHNVGKELFLRYKGYKATAFTFSHFIIQIRPKIKVGYAVLFDYRFNFGILPYNTLHMVRDYRDLEGFYKDYLKGEKVGLACQLLLWVAIVLIEIVNEKFLLLPHAVTLPVIIYLCQSFEGQTNHGALAKIRNTDVDDMIYYLAQGAVYLPGDKKWIYDALQQKILAGQIPEKYQYMAIQSVKHMYMEKCCHDDTITIDESLYDKFLDEFCKLSIWGMGDFREAEKFDLLKVMTCYAIITKNETQLSDIKNCYVEMYEAWNLYKNNQQYQWYANLARNKTIRKVDWLFKPEVIRKNGGLNKLDRYCYLEKEIIKKTREICPEI